MRCHSHALTTVMRFQITIVVLMLCVLSALARVCGLCPTHKLIRFLCFHFGHRRLAFLSTFVGTFVIKPKRPVTLSRKAARSHKDRRAEALPPQVRSRWPQLKMTSFWVPGGPKLRMAPTQDGVILGSRRAKTQDGPNSR